MKRIKCVVYLLTAEHSGDFRADLAIILTLDLTNEGITQHLNILISPTLNYTLVHLTRKHCEKNCEGEGETRCLYSMDKRPRRNELTAILYSTANLLPRIIQSVVDSRREFFLCSPFPLHGLTGKYSRRETVVHD